ncbi:MAG: hypothetical protein DRQ02_01395 [Candidatus Latescibacterota bacterium]|nr:MAG: hypothetical protein DRQ02_01395 [Candidatus Latescibacterota bacterium]
MTIQNFKRFVLMVDYGIEGWRPMATEDDWADIVEAKDRHLAMCGGEHVEIMEVCRSMEVRILKRDILSRIPPTLRCEEPYG